MAIKKQSFMKGVFVIMGSQILIKILGFIYRIIQTNFPQFADVGNSYYGSGYQVYTFILAIATMGIPNTISKLVSEKITVGDRKGAHKIFKTAFLVFVSIATAFALALFFGAGFIANNILHNPGVQYTLMSLSPAIIFVSMSAVLRGYFIGMGNVSEYSKAQIIEQIINCVFSIIFVVMLLGTTPEIMAAGSTLATTVATSSAFLYLVMYYKKNRNEIWSEINKAKDFAQDSRKKIAKKLISYALPISFGSVVSALAGLIDVVTVVSGLTAYGLANGMSQEASLLMANEKYGILSGKVDILLAVPLSINVAFSVALVPFISSAIARHRKDEAVSKIKYSLKISSLIAMPCAVGFFVLANQIFQMLFPNAPEGAYLLQIQSFLVFFSVVSQTITGALQGVGKLAVPGIALLVGAILKYILNVIFIPIFGEAVPAITSIIYSATACIISATVLYRTLKEKMPLKEVIIKPLIASVVMGLAVFGAYKLFALIGLGNTIATILSIGVGVIVYFIGVILLRVLDKEEIQQLPYGNKICKMLKI
ncbi:MAG: polysaccharide biosynthesis protein [Clostridia bacterium]|nr:polysaccharide biosynthesis protein [Clostridia bacterium]